MEKPTCDSKQDRLVEKCWRPHHLITTWLCYPNSLLTNFLQFALMDLCLSQEISQVWARLEVTHQLKNQFLIVQIDALVRQIAVRLNILLLKKIAIWTVTVNQVKLSTKTIVFAVKVIQLDSLLIISTPSIQTFETINDLVFLL